MSILIKGMEMPKVAGRMEAVITILKDGTAQIAISPADDGIGYWKEYPLIFVPPHGDLIDRDVLYKEFERIGWFDNADRDIAEDLVLDAPTVIPAADVQPVVHGKWSQIKILQDGYKAKECSACKATFWDLYRWNYCPNCGARMDMED